MAENEHSLTAGPRGPVMLQDVWLLENWLTLTEKSFLNAVCMPKAGEATTERLPLPMTFPNGQKPRFSARGQDRFMFIRFSTVAGERGAADAERDIRGIAVRVLH